MEQPARGSNWPVSMPYGLPMHLLHLSPLEIEVAGLECATAVACMCSCGALNRCHTFSHLPSVGNVGVWHIIHKL